MKKLIIKINEETHSTTFAKLNDFFKKLTKKPIKTKMQIQLLDKDVIAEHTLSGIMARRIINNEKYRTLFFDKFLKNYSI